METLLFDGQLHFLFFWCVCVLVFYTMENANNAMKYKKKKVKAQTDKKEPELWKNTSFTQKGKG